MNATVARANSSLSKTTGAARRLGVFSALVAAVLVTAHDRRRVRMRTKEEM